MGVSLEQVQIIHSKLIPPVPQATYMRLPNLNKKMNIAQDYPLTIVQSGPGYGKSLSLAQFMKDNRLTFSWYTVTSEDDNIIPFMTYLIKSIERTYPSFGSSLKDVKIRANFLKDEELERWLALFVKELLDIPHPFTIIIDDFHEVAHEFHINKLMERIVELLPPHIRVVISTRIRPKWSNLLKMKMKDQLFDITEKDFLFTKEETAFYLEDFYHLHLTESEIEDIYHFTEGWAIALNLIAYQLKEGELSLSSKSPMLQNLFNYLSDEVFQRRTELEREWLLKFAIFPTFSKKLIAEFYHEEAVELLQTLVNEHGFIQALDGGSTYRYHSLFYRFLKSKWMEVDRDLYVSLHKKATSYFDLNDNYIEATYHATQTEDPAFIGDVLIKTASPLIRSGQFDWFLQIYEELDEKIINERYLLYYFTGEVHRYRAFYEQARRAYVTCMKFAKRDGNEYLLSRSYAGIAHIFLDTIQPGLAEKYLRKAIEWSQKTDDMKEEEKLMLKRQFAENLVNLGRATDAKLWAKKERLPETVLRRGNLDARIYLRMGKLIEAEKILLEETTRTNVPESHRETQVLLSFIHSLTGDVTLALENAKAGIKTGEKLNSGFVRAVGYTRVGHAEMLHNPYHLDEAERHYEKAIDMMKQLNVPRGLVEPTMGLSVLLARKGKYREAIELSKIAVRETEKVNDQWMLALVFTSIGLIYFYDGNYLEAEEYMKKAQYLFDLGGDSYGKMICHFWFAMIFYKLERINQAILHLRSFLHILDTEHYSFFLKKDTFFGPFDREMMYPVIAHMLSHDKTLSDLKVINEFSNFDNNHPGYHIYISIFDSVNVYVSTNLHEELLWKREKAKEMLIYFLLNANRLLPKEEIILALWPNSNQDDDRNFKVTLNYLLKVIEPNRKARQQSFFIERHQTMYRLNKRAKVISDMHLFERFIEKGFTTDDDSESLVYLLKANEIYKGSPFEEYRHIDSVMTKKEELENKYVRMHEKIAQLYVAIGQYNHVIYWAEKLIGLDKTWEEGYRLLMIAYFELQNRPQSIKWYEKCKAVLQEELNIEPMESTVRLYEMIVNEEEIFNL